MEYKHHLLSEKEKYKYCLLTLQDKNKHNNKEFNDCKYKLKFIWSSLIYYEKRYGFNETEWNMLNNDHSDFVKVAKDIYNIPPSFKNTNHDIFTFPKT